ncbi:MAG: hypothetical protein ACFB15_16235 [Cyclobacteriaceae bacterium]
MRMAGIVMAVVGFVAIVLSGLSLMEEASLDRFPPMFGNSWIVIMALFWFFAGVSLVIAYGKEDKSSGGRA